jgi:competence protein ComEC
LVLGQKAVNLPRLWRDRFAQVGLAHVIAASGFHVALLLGVVLRLTPNLAPIPQSLIGIVCLGGYVGLTGLQPSILRAALMGVGVLLARIGDRQIRPLGSLLLTATILLVFNPLWIGDLGFQLSFLATLGLMVSLNPIQKSLDWLPPVLASAIALPLAANLWVLPLILQIFRVVPTYSIIVNVLTAPLVLVISLGGMISGFAGLVLPVAGSAIALLLWLPLWLLLAIVQFFEQLPLSAYAVGQIPTGVTVGVYGILIAIATGTLKSPWRWLLWGIIPVLLIVPPAYSRLTLQQVTLLPVTREPVLLVQDRGKTVLIGGNDLQTLQYTIQPYLNYQGVNHLDCWLLLLPQPRQADHCLADSSTFPAQKLGDRSRLQSPTLNQSLTVGDFTLRWQSLQPTILQIQYQQRSPWWVIAGAATTPLPSLPKNIGAVIGQYSQDRGDRSVKIKALPHSNQRSPLEASTRWDGMAVWTPTQGWHLLSEDASTRSVGE